jgi:neutral ceramidase
MPLPVNVYFQALRIGDLIWLTTPCDFSGEYALHIKNSLAVQGYSSIVTSFNGSYIGYVVPGKYFYKDEYESKLMGWFGPNMGDYAMDIIAQISKIVMTPWNTRQTSGQ